MPTLNWIGKEAVVNHDKEVPFRLLKKVNRVYEEEFFINQLYFKRQKEKISNGSLKRAKNSKRNSKGVQN